MESNDIVMDLQNSALKMTGWLKFVGIVTIVSGALAALFCHLPAYPGLRLRPGHVRFSGNCG